MSNPITPRDLAYLLLGNPEISEATMRALEIKGDLPQLIAPTYSVDILAEDLTAPEYRWLRRQSRWLSGLAQAQVAANFAFVAFSSANVDPARPTMAIVDQILVRNNGAASTTYRYGMAYVAGGPALTQRGALLDDRQFGQTSFYLIGAGVGVAHVLTPAPFGLIEIQGGASFLIPGPWVLSNRPDNAALGASLIVETEFVNNPVCATFYWRERAFLQTER